MELPIDIGGYWSLLDIAYWILLKVLLQIMALDNGTRFQIMAGAAISIGWVLKLNSEAPNEGQYFISHLSLISLPGSSTNSPLLHENIQKKYCLHMMSKEEDLYCVMANARLTSRELNGINWGHWYIKPRSLHWWNLFFPVIMADDPTQFRQIFCVSIATFYYITEFVAPDLERNPPRGLASLPNRKLEVT